jgi:replication factor A1
MLGMDAEALHAIREADPAKYERAVKRAQFGDWHLKLKAKTEEYQGESRRRLTVLQCAKPDYAAEAKHLLGLIQAIRA